MNIVKYEDIPLEYLTIGLSQARVRDVQKNIDDLAQSIAKLGLIEPIVVAPAEEEGKFEVVTGQRRFLAVSKLGHGTIRAGILDRAPDGNLAKAISLTENMVREDMPDKDYIDACTALFRVYGSIKAVSEELGLPYHKVQKFVKFDQLIPELKEQVESGDIKMDMALRAQKAATRDGEVDQEMATALASEMKGMAGVQQRKLEQIAQKNPYANLEEILDAGRKQAKSKNITITIAESESVALDSYAQEEGVSATNAAIGLIFSGLVERGYLEEE